LVSVPVTPPLHAVGLVAMLAACSSSTTPGAAPADVVLAGLTDAVVPDAGPVRACPGALVANDLSCEVLGGPLAAPRDVWVTRDGAVFVTEMGAGTLVRLDGDRFVRVASGLQGPIGLREAADGALLVGEEGARSVARIDRGTGARTLLAGDLGSVTYLALGPDGAVFASSFDNVGPFGTGRVTRVDPATGATARYATGLNVPEGLFLDASGALFVAEWALPSSVRRFAPGGGDVGTSAVVATDLTNVYGLLPDGAGGMFIGDHAGRVLRQRADGAREVILDRIGRPGGMARAADGALLVAEFVDFNATGRLLRVRGLR
jgi:streptogramin lyase